MTQAEEKIASARLSRLTMAMKAFYKVHPDWDVQNVLQCLLNEQKAKKNTEKATRLDSTSSAPTQFDTLAISAPVKTKSSQKVQYEASQVVPLEASREVALELSRGFMPDATRDEVLQASSNSKAVHEDPSAS